MIFVWTGEFGEAGLGDESVRAVPYARAAAATTVRSKAMIAAIKKIHFVTVGQVSVPSATDNSAPNGLPGICSPVSATV